MIQASVDWIRNAPRWYRIVVGLLVLLLVAIWGINSWHSATRQLSGQEGVQTEIRWPRDPVDPNLPDQRHVEVIALDDTRQGFQFAQYQFVVTIETNRSQLAQSDLMEWTLLARLAFDEVVPNGVVPTSKKGVGEKIAVAISDKLKGEAGLTVSQVIPVLYPVELEGVMISST